MIALVALMFGTFPAPVTAARAEALTADERWCPREVAPYCSENAFLDFWRRQPNALESLGYPIDHARSATDGRMFQFYERAIMEWHPDNEPEYQVLLTPLGTKLADAIPLERRAPRSESCAGDCVRFAETGKTLRGEFLDYWRANGGLPIFGLPVTEPMQERNVDDGQTYLVQYFERNRFEFHPENAGRYRVLLGRLGAEVLELTRPLVMCRPTATVPNYGGGGTAPAPPLDVPSPDSAPHCRYP
jgi:hypothetical protein